MGWVAKIIVAFVLIASYAGVAHADNFPKPIQYPRPNIVANVLGNKLAADPRVAYPPDKVNCWFPDTDVFTFKCDAFHKIDGRRWRFSKDVLYGVHMKLYEDGSFTIRYTQLANWTTTVRKF